MENDNWISVEQEPDDQALVIIDNGQPITSPARYNKAQKLFERYPNHTAGDRAIVYHYVNVQYWRQFPKPNTI